MGLFKKLVNDYKAVVTNPFRSSENKIQIQTGLGSVASKLQSVTGALKNEIGKAVLPGLIQKQVDAKTPAQLTEAVNKTEMATGFNLAALVNQGKAAIGNTGIGGALKTVSGNITFGDNPPGSAGSTGASVAFAAAAIPIVITLAVVAGLFWVFKKIM